MSSEIKFSTVINLALEFLAEDETHWENNFKVSEYSCDAITTACNELLDNKIEADNLKYKINDYLEEFGLDVGSIHAFKEFEDKDGVMTEESQQARAIWLTWAAMIAEEEGN